MFQFIKKRKRRIYMDYASGTPVDKSVSKVMRKYSSKRFANPSAIHKEGMAAREAINRARATIADILGSHSDEIVFTSGGTEGDNLAILGVVNVLLQEIDVDQYSHQRREKPHIIITNIEHSAVREVCRELKSQGRIELTEVPVDQGGIISPDKIKRALRGSTVLISVMYANNEIGTIQPIREISKVIRHHRKAIKTQKHKNTKTSAKTNLPFFHTDAAQAISYLPIKVEKLGVDLLTFNGSKIYGPRGIGVLYKKREVPFLPIMYGGSQEHGLRPGTENTANIIGLAKALELAKSRKEKESKRLTTLRDYFIKELQERFQKIIINGDSYARLPNNVNISIPSLESELLVLELDARGVAVSAKSACKSAEPGESYVIHALRDDHRKEESSLRLSLGRKTTRRDIDYVLRALEDILKKYGIKP